MGRRTVTFDYLEISPINTSEVYDVNQQTSRGEEHHTRTAHMFEADKALLGRRSKLHSCARLTWNGRGGVRQAEVQQLMQLDSASTPASVLVELVKASHVYDWLWKQFQSASYRFLKN